MTDHDPADPTEALVAVLEWLILKEGEHQCVANMRKPVAIRKAREALQGTPHWTRVQALLDGGAA